MYNSQLSDYSHVLQGSEVDHEGHSTQLKIVELLSFQYFYLHQHRFYIPFDSSMGFPIYNITFYGKCRRNYFHFGISLIELLAYNNKLNCMVLYDPPHCFGAHVNNH